MKQDDNCILIIKYLRVQSPFKGFFSSYLENHTQHMHVNCVDYIVCVENCPYKHFARHILL